ncbi:MAG: purine-nucleoside phosphorylase [Desulfosarcinaceae bacterium]
MTDANRAQAVESAEFLRSQRLEPPQAAVLTGTGLGDITASMEVSGGVDYADIPHFPVSTVQSHHGRLVYGRMSGINVAVLQGRFHLYEGYTPRQVTFPIRVMQELGAKTLVLTNASGGLNPEFATGDIMVVGDHINLTGANPLVGPNDEPWGPRFPDMSAAYDTALRALALEKARQLGLEAQQGVYAGLKGPSLETPAEMRFLRTIGADAVGFSTVMETIAAVHAGMRVLGLSIITNMNLPDAPLPASVDDIIAVARKAAPGLEKLIAAVMADTAV